MSTPEAIIRAANQAVLHDGALDAVEQFFATDYVAHGTTRDLKGRAGVRRFVSATLAAFADIHTEVVVLMVEGDRVAWQRRWSAKHTASFQGFPATNKPLVLRDLVVSRIEAGKIAEDWLVTDMAEQLLRAR